MFKRLCQRKCDLPLSMHGYKDRIRLYIYRCRISQYVRPLAMYDTLFASRFLSYCTHFWNVHSPHRSLRKHDWVDCMLILSSYWTKSPRTYLMFRIHHWKRLTANLCMRSFLFHTIFTFIPGTSEWSKISPVHFQAYPPFNSESEILFSMS